VAGVCRYGKGSSRVGMLLVRRCLPKKAAVVDVELERLREQSEVGSEEAGTDAWARHTCQHAQLPRGAQRWWYVWQRHTACWHRVAARP